jgi:hypothetical protein
LVVVVVMVVVVVVVVVVVWWWWWRWFCRNLFTEHELSTNELFWKMNFK